MKYIIKNEISIDRPMVFLCGPKYEEKEFDRRKILKDFLAKDFAKNVLPVIVDIFLDKKKINDSTISIPLMEEICAAVSAKTYIFLDTFSAVAELGIFSSASYANKICVLMPNRRDKLIDDLNFFVTEVFNSGKDIESIYYRPRITRVPRASDFVAEFYEFPYNQIPENIKDDIEIDNVYDIANCEVKFNRRSKIPVKLADINYTTSKTEYDININLRMFFYLVASIHLEFNIDNPDIIFEKLKEIVINTLEVNNPKLRDVSIKVINVGLNYNETDIIKHIIKFVTLFMAHAQITGEKIITKSTAIIQGISANEYFQFDKTELQTINTYIKSPSLYIEAYKLKIGKKSRQITKYRDDDYGIALRNIHAKIAIALSKNYCFNDSSYAYRKSYGILDCVKQHQNSNGFFAIDIHKFFNSIQYRQLYKVLRDNYSCFFKGSEEFELIVKSLMYKNQIPLGFTISPLVSDIYLHDFDIYVIRRLSEIFPEIIYTRYADDMFFSSNNYIDNECGDTIMEIVRIELAKIRLEVNEDKTRLINIVNSGDHVKLLGLNIVKNGISNKITVGKKYIYETAKLYLDYISGVKNGEIVDEDKYYKERVISGRVSYIKQIEGEKGYNILKDRIKFSTKGRVEIQGNKILFE
jgi:RNA-directed DNA polymerase